MKTLFTLGLWFFIGSIALNVIWAYRYSVGNPKKFKFRNFWKGLLFGLIQGPLTFLWLIKFYKNHNNERSK